MKVTSSEAAKIEARIPEFDKFIQTTLYKDDMWELIENDAFTYALLVAKRQMVLQRLHDFVDHAASAKSEGWTYASKVATAMYAKFSDYFQQKSQGNIPSHLIPFAAGVILDELTQIPYYHSEGRIAAIRLLLDKIDELNINPFSPLTLRDFPMFSDDVTEAARSYRSSQDMEFIRLSVDRTASEVAGLTY